VIDAVVWVGVTGVLAPIRKNSLTTRPHANACPATGVPQLTEKFTAVAVAVAMQAGVVSTPPIAAYVLHSTARREALNQLVETLDAEMERKATKGGAAKTRVPSARTSRRRTAHAP
jgi:hypothetical protein